MKKKRKLLCMLLTVIICITQAIPVMGASNYNRFISGTLRRQLGVAATGKTLRSKTTYGWGDWCKTNGIVSTYESDFNGDRKKDLLVLYLKKEKRKYGHSPAYQRTMRLALYTKKGSSVKKVQDIRLDTGIDLAMGAWSHAFVYQYGEKKYILYQSTEVSQGQKCTWIVLTVNSKNQFVVKTAIVDPGYTSGVGLYRISSRISASRITNAVDYYSPRSGTVLYENEWSGRQNNRNYVRALTRELKKYGITLSKKRHVLTTFSRPGNTYFMTANRKSKTNLFTIKATTKYARRVYSNTCVIRDYTKTRNKL